jgi:outer membrane protein OmpA-like peptidoglycan-associated protein
MSGFGRDMTARRYLAPGLLFAALFASGCASNHTLVVLFPEEGGTAGAITVGASGRTVVLDQPYSAAAVDRQGSVAARAVTREEANRTFADALAAQPRSSISFMLYFETNSLEVTSASRPALEALLAEVSNRTAVEVQVTGHTDRVGSQSDNDRLSLQRAEAVRAMLIKRGIQSTFLRAVGRGEREPLIATPDEQAEPRNRRVEVIVR